MAKTYWLDLFTYETWTEFLAAGATVSGFSDNRWKTVQNMKPGDVLLCYLTGVSRWIGLLEVTGPAFRDNSKIWSRSEFPARVPVKLIAKLEPITAVPVLEMRDSLSIFKNLKGPHAWTGRFRGSPSKWTNNDGDAVANVISAAISNPVERPFDPAKLARVPPILRTAAGTSVVIPEDEESLPLEQPPIRERVESSEELVPNFGHIQRFSGYYLNWVAIWAWMFGWQEMTAVKATGAKRFSLFLDYFRSCRFSSTMRQIERSS